MDLIVAQYGSSSSSGASCSGSSDEEDTTAGAPSSNGTDSGCDHDDAAGRAVDRKRKRGSEVPWVRAFAHVDGNWPSHVHVSIGDDAELRALCARVISGAQQTIVDTGGSDSALVPMDDYHLSLSRPFVLQYDQIGAFVDELRAALKWRRRFVVALSGGTVLVNDEQTRSFLALCVSGGEKELVATVKCVDKCMKQFALPLYYEVWLATYKWLAGSA